MRPIRLKNIAALRLRAGHGNWLRWLTPRRSLFIVLLVFAALAATNQTWRKQPIQSDAAGYYAWLPAVAIHHDLSFGRYFDTVQRAQYKQTMEGRELELWFFKVDTVTHYALPKFSIGMAMMNSPFFVAGMALDKVWPGGWPGYGPAFQFMAWFASLFYGLLGLWLFAKLMRRYFSSRVVGLGILSLALCSNMLFYYVLYPCQSHPVNFFLFVLFTYLSVTWLDGEGIQWQKALGIGLCLGMIALIRPVNVVIGLVLLLYNVKSWGQLGNRALFWLARWQWILLALLAFAVVWVPQLLIWKQVTGHYFHYSYGKEKLWFDDPQLLDGLFSFRNGWLIYSPLMTLCLVGWFLLPRHAPSWRWLVPIFGVLFMYIIWSWWCWWYGGGFGMRPMIEATALLSIGLMATYRALLQMRYGHMVIASLLVGTFTLNLWQSIQSKRAIIKPDMATAASYRYLFFKTKRTEADEAMLKNMEKFPRYDPNFSPSQQ